MNEGKPGPPGEEPTTRPEGHDGDFELARPDREPAAAGDDHRGDYELDRPLRPEGLEAPPAEPGPGAPTSGPGAAEPATSGAPADEPAGSVSSAVPAPGASGTSAGSSSPAVPAPAVSDPPPVAFEPSVPGQQRPLHDPDPYSTPPYGEPGPWAPAPPVQHPAATPAHGMALAAPPTAPDAAPPTAPAQHGTPPAAPPGPGTGPHGTPVPPGTPAPHGAPALADAGPHGAPAAAAIPAQAHPDTQASPPQDTPTADPWGRYDPWAAAAAAAPLQQAGHVVVDRKRRRGRVLVGAALLLALVSGGIGGIVGTYLERNGGVGTVELPQAGKEASGRAPGSVAGIAAQALPSVVTLHVSGAGEAGTGTGFVLDGRGHILTNDHVVEPAGDDGEITVTFHSGDTAEATVVGRDSGYDLAVVKVKGVSGLTPLPLGNSDNVRVGDPVVAIGAPFDLAGTVTSGIISARERPITAGGEKGDGSDVSYVDALQTDAPINPGNSGGPLLDAKARVIGINSAIRSADGGADPDAGQSGSIGLGFAIPINQGKRVAEELINTGQASHPVIGITLDMEYGGDGARVAAEGSDGGPPVSTGGPGDRAGIKAGDVITEVDGRRVHSGEELIVKTRAHRPGDRLELTLQRDGDERTVTLTLGSSEGD
ncbi:trypsin-like peptidase domain-containing protein [Streptomyces sp. AC558_RSS880]|uniref:trypsin-like peptidase domain-containing protein n=1 Tax=Streptomyces sp. AC558_RSS880 TaxID=2823687 RepID=UPI001C24CDAA|nr:trypsin-like peptidase domain-containing protein [Streptomyces sp. AC558_RSS880]